ncbi:thymidylate kinase [Micromonospora sp. Llam0]|uniref:thymidylate kinase n=1 Tax=Micromonospora sp. Llam0 TaxID=2485143 RepID=UPI001315698B|nr:thymidylate kinase [Micromonospora sp. Llam0]
MNRPAHRWVSVEGINGVGKTYLSSRLANRLGGSCRMLSELTDQGAGQGPDQLAGRVVAALTGPGGTFLRTGHPLTETFALLALKVYEYERLTRTAPRPPAVVLEDRGPDTVAVYQAAILGSGQPPDVAQQAMRRLGETVELWRPQPTLTLLLVDDLDRCIDRFEARLGAPLAPADRDLLARIARLYDGLAAAHPHRIQVVNLTGRTEEDVLDEMDAWCRPVLRQADAA